MSGSRFFDIIKNQPLIWGFEETSENQAYRRTLNMSVYSYPEA